MYGFGTLGGGTGLCSGLRMGSGRSAAGGPDAKAQFLSVPYKIIDDYIINDH